MNRNVANERARGTPRIGLVLGSGGPAGHAYHCGVLHALATATGWDPRTADIIVGTSAGAQVAALLRAGMSAPDLAARARGNALTPEGAEGARHYVRPSHDEPHPDHPFTLRPAAASYLGRSLVRAGIRWTPAAPLGLLDRPMGRSRIS